MNEKEFRKYVYFLAKLHSAGKFTALETGRKLHDLACRYLQDHQTLPRGFEGFDF